MAEATVPTLSKNQADGDVFVGPAAPPLGYLGDSRRPLVSLAFTLPLLVCYEIGVVWAGVQNGADVWMRLGLDYLGFTWHLLLPLLAVGILLGWHHLRHEPWRVSGRTLGLMCFECLVWAVVLWELFRAHQALLGALPQAAQPRRPVDEILLSVGGLPEIVGYFGAGVYEELLFRLILLSAAMALLRPWLSWGKAAIVAVIVTSLFFSAAHHIGPNGDRWLWPLFSFRTLAGAYFALLFVYRGFGIAAGSHAAYDVLVGALVGGR